MTTGRDTLSKSEAVTIAAIESSAPCSSKHEHHRGFPCHDPKKSMAELDAWIKQAKASLVASLANGVMKDKAAVRAAIISALSNGQTEGQITKLKLVKRQMYGRGNSICSKHASSAPIEREVHQNCVRANFQRRSTSAWCNRVFQSFLDHASLQQ